MAHPDIDEIIDLLNREQKIVLEVLPRIPKSNSNRFHQKALGRKKRCWEINVEAVLRSLANLGLVELTERRGYWRTTKLGRLVSHRLHDEANVRRYGFRVVRR